MSNTGNEKTITVREAAEMLGRTADVILCCLGIEITGDCMLKDNEWSINDVKILGIRDVIQLAIAMKVSDYIYSTGAPISVLEKLQQLQAGISESKIEDLGLLKYPQDKDIENILVVFFESHNYVGSYVLRKDLKSGKCTQIRTDHNIMKFPYPYNENNLRIEEIDSGMGFTDDDEDEDFYISINITKIIKRIKFPKEVAESV